MTQVETVTRDARSYRQGLVLGLTMAEVFLLLVFALLIALAALWNSERQKRKALETGQGQSQQQSAVDTRLLEGLRDAMRASSRDKVVKALDHLKNGRDLEPLTRPEKDFVTEVRTQQSGATPGVISDQWRTLTRAAQNLSALAGTMDLGEAVRGALPNEKDPKRVEGLIERGIASEKKGEHDWPPIINVSYAKDCFFEIGRAELTPCFETRLRAHVPELLDIAARFGVRTIEVIGHTDEQKIIPRNSNLDALLLDILHHAGNVSSLIPADNAGLGLARATAVVRVLMLDERLKGYTLLPLSGGQLIGVDDRLTKGGGGDERERRRIEIRVRRANSTEGSTSTLTPPAITPAKPPKTRVVSPPATVPQPRAASPPATPPPPRQSPPPDRAAAPQWLPFGITPSQAAPVR
jgi:flagellar motor protein MotB